MNFFNNYKSSLILLISIIAGSLIGLLLGEKAIILKGIANLFLNLLFCVVVPLIFISLITSIANSKNSNIFKQSIIIMLIIFFISGLISSISGLFVCYFFDFSTNIKLDEKISNIYSNSDVLSMFSVSNFYELFSRQNLIALIVFSVIFGIALLNNKEKCNNVLIFFNELNIIITKLTNIIMKFAPIGLACFFAVTFGTSNNNISSGISKAIIIFFTLTPIFFIIYNTLFAYIANKKQGVKELFKNIPTSIMVSLGTCSSVAVIPSNIKACRNLNINENINTLTISLAANINKPGSVLLAIFKIAVLCAVFNIDLFTTENIIKAIIVAILIGSVVGPIPTGGYISEMIIVNTFFLPVEQALPIAILIGTIADAPATMINAASDVSVTMVVDKFMKGKQDG